MENPYGNKEVPRQTRSSEEIKAAPKPTTPAPKSQSVPQQERLGVLHKIRMFEKVSRSI